jgi:PAS domain S-box-containing protein
MGVGVTLRPVIPMIEQTKAVERKQAEEAFRQTDKQLAEEALRESEERFRQAMEATNDGLWDWNVKTGEVYYSPAYSRILGYEPAEFANHVQSWIDFLHPDDRAKALSVNQACIENRIPAFEIEFRMRTKGGEWKTILGRGKAVCRDADGRAIRMIGTHVDITERKRAEEALKRAHDELERRAETRTAELTETNEQLALFREFAEASGQGFGMGDLEGRIAYVNPTLCRLMGEEKPENVIGKHFFAYYPEGWKQRRANEVLPALERDGHWEGELPIISRQGTATPTLHHAFLLQDEEGRPVRRCVVVTDITERKRTDDALRQAHEELQAIYDGMPDGLLIADAETKRFVRANPSICAMLGYSEAELLAMSVMDIHPAGDLSAVLDAFQAQLEGRLHVASSLPVLRRDGSIVYADITSNPIVYNGRSCLIGFFRDVTERRNAEAALRESEERYRAVVEDQTEIICRFNADGTYTFVNDVFCRFFGKKSDDLVGMKWQPSALAEDVPMIEKQLHTMSPHNTIVLIENRVRSGRGEVHWMQFVNRGFYDSQGRLVEVQSVGRDITERKRLEAALAREHRTLKHLLQSSDHERQLIAYEIHDGLAQQLTGTIMQFETYVYQKDKQPRLAAEAFDAGMTMLRQGHFEARRLISGVRPPILDEAGIVAAIAQLVNEERHKKGPKIEYLSKVEFERLTPILENAIYRIVQEALNNACTHSKSKRVRVELVQHGDKVRIEVRDRGIGFKPEDIDDESHFGVAGIRERARLLGGSAQIESSPGKGTRIVVELPIVLRSDEDDEAPGEERAEPSPGGSPEQDEDWIV